MEAAVVVLGVACCCLSLCVTALAATVPFLWYKFLKAEEKVATLDEALAALMENIGVPKE